MSTGTGCSPGGACISRLCRARRRRLHSLIVEHGCQTGDEAVDLFFRAGRVVVEAPEQHLTHLAQWHPRLRCLRRWRQWCPQPRLLFQKFLGSGRAAFEEPPPARLKKRGRRGRVIPLRAPCGALLAAHRCCHLALGIEQALCLSEEELGQHCRAARAGQRELERCIALGNGVGGSIKAEEAECGVGVARQEKRLDWRPRAQLRSTSSLDGSPVGTERRQVVAHLKALPPSVLERRQHG
eukprot:scaffold33789_cov101-Isochrysis_galbana.AAC.2